MATVDTTLFDCDVLWLDAHDAIVHWHNGRVYIDVRRDDGLRVQENGSSLATCLQRAMRVAKKGGA
jgi:hypothetical protein